jgi:hypothetical protein
MGANPRIVTQDRHISWDGVTQRLPKGQVLDVPPGSALEAEIGREYLVPLGAVAAQPEPEKPAAKPQQEEPDASQPAKAKPRAAKAGNDDKDGES